MQSIPDANVSRKNRRIFYVTTIFLLLWAIVATVIQKQHEGAVAITVAKGGDAQQHIQNALYWGKVSFLTVALAIISWGIALWRCEEHHWVRVPAIVLLLLYVLLQLLMV